ncbi:MAG: tRNA dihydrouridine synthase DusB [Coriobacteriia bacterium]|nr:tRNA dihydrouridine synthase DusB [Coriobacteriia bacterium]
MSSVETYLKENPIWLAPMAGVNDAAFRVLCKEAGAGLTFTEMVSAKGLHYSSSNNNSRMLLKLAPEEVPVAVQIFGADPTIMASQARVLVEQLGNNLAFIDVNMGCPVPKVVNKGEGSALMRSSELAAEIIAAIVEAVGGLGTCVTAKFRRGWDEESENTVAFAQTLEAAGASALTVHGRFRSQFYRGVSERSVIARVKEHVAVPVIGSGDVLTAYDAVSMLVETGADGVMIARGAQGNPWIFTQSAELLSAYRTEQKLNPTVTLEEVSRATTLTTPTYRERFDMMRRHAQLIERYFGGKSLVRMRKHAIWYCAGLPGASFFRHEINSISSMEDLTKLIDAYDTYLSR